MRQPNPLGCLSHALITHQCVAFEITLPVQFHSQTRELGRKDLANEQKLQSSERCGVCVFEPGLRPRWDSDDGRETPACGTALERTEAVTIIFGEGDYDTPNHTFEFIFRQIGRVRGGSRRDVPGFRDAGVRFAADISGARS
jgi:hypothetical protein